MKPIYKSWKILAIFLEICYDMFSNFKHIIHKLKMLKNLILLYKTNDLLIKVILYNMLNGLINFKAVA